MIGGSGFGNRSCGGLTYSVEVWLLFVMLIRIAEPAGAKGSESNVTLLDLTVAFAASARCNCRPFPAIGVSTRTRIGEQELHE